MGACSPSLSPTVSLPSPQKKIIPYTFYIYSWKSRCFNLYLKFLLLLHTEISACTFLLFQSNNFSVVLANIINDSDCYKNHYSINPSQAACILLHLQQRRRPARPGQASWWVSKWPVSAWYCWINPPRSVTGTTAPLQTSTLLSQDTSVSLSHKRQPVTLDVLATCVSFTGSPHVSPCVTPHV